MWRKALETKPSLPNKIEYGWYLDAHGGIQPKLMEQEPFPSTYKQLVQCGCKTDCIRSNCMCSMNKLPCITVCGCSLEQCHNIYTNQDTDDESV